MTSISRSGSSRRKPEAPGRIRLQLKGKSSKILHSDEEDDNSDEEGPVAVDGIPDDLPEGTVIVQPQAVDDAPLKKKRDPPVRIDTSILDNVSCTACGRQLNPYKNSALQKHPELKVVICKRCDKFLSSGEIAKDKDGTDEQCRWCGEGGRLVVCDECASAFCRACVMRNFNRSEFTNINSQPNWKCYICDKAPLQGLREKYRKIRDTLKALQARDKAKAAAPTSNGTAKSENSAKQPESKSSASHSAPKSNAAAASTPQKAETTNPVTDNVVLSLKDLDIAHENVEIMMDKLSTSTTTFKEMLRALRSQFHSTSPRSAEDPPPMFKFSISSQMDIEEKKRRCAKALSMGLVTYFKSLKSILSSDSQLSGDAKNKPVTQVKEATNSVPKPMTKTGSAAPSKATESSKKVYSSSSSSSLSDDSDAEVVQAKHATEKKKVTSKEKVKSSEDHSKKAGTKSNDGKSNITGSNKTKSKEKESSGSKTCEDKTQRSNAETAKKSTGKDAADAGDIAAVAKKTPSLKLVKLSSEDLMNKKDKEHSSEKAQESEVADTSAPPAHVEKDGVDENMAAKFDLIKELGEEMNTDKEQEEADLELPVTFQDPTLPDDSQKDTAEAPKAKRKKPDVTSDEEKSGEKVNKKSKKPDSSNPDTDNKNSGRKDGKKSKKPDGSESNHDTDDEKSKDKKSKKPTGSESNHDTDDEKSKDKKSKKPTGSESNSDTTEEKKVRNTSSKKEANSSSDLFMSSDDETPKETNKKKESTKTEASKSKQVSKKEDKPETNGDTAQADKDDYDEVEKEINKLAKMPVIRKRKAKELDADQEVDGEVKQTAAKVARVSKPGPKCSKKTTDYDDLSSDGDGNEKPDSENEKADSENESDEEDGPKVTFFVDSEAATEKKDEHVEDEENEMAKTDILEEMGSDVEDKEDDDDSSDAESNSSKKTKAKKEVKAKTATKKESEEDSDENIGVKRKQIRSKLLDTKLSDSDSDVDKPKKKVKEEDGDFKGSNSSDSSIESDLSDDLEEEEEEDDDSDKDSGDDGEKKGKKKGKKKSKRKRKGKTKKGSDDDAESDEDEEGGKKKKKGKSRRRIKKMSDSSEDEEKQEEDDDDDDPNSSKAGKRKQIRKVMSNKKLEDSTKAAAKAEEKRRRRIAAKQREFNIETIKDDNNPMDCPITTKLILEAGKEEGDEPLVQVNLKLVRKLKPHQVDAIQFMWDCLFESVKRSKKEPGAGCILAHCMGLGKTLSVIAFVHTILSHEKVLKQKTCLVVSPLNTVLNWRNEWTMWFDEEDQLEVWELASCKQNAARASALKDWQESGGIMIIGYEMYRNLTTGSRCKNKRQKKVFVETLVDPGPDIVICDEGHILKNEASAISKAMNQMRTRRRVVLTGTPLQNNLNEYHCMLSFVKPNLLGTRKEFNNRFISPIQNGQCNDSTPRDVKLMKARAHILHEMLAGCVQRRDYSALTKFLPPKQEYVISVRLTNIQIELYEKYMELTGQGVDGVFSNKGARLFTDYQNLMKIWTHPWVLKLAEIRDESKVKFDDEDSFIDDDDSDADRSFSSSNTTSEDEKKESDSGGEGTSSRPNMARGTKRTRAKARRQAGEDSDPEEVIAEWKSKTRGKEEEEGAEDQDKAVTKEWWAPYVTEDDKNKLELSNKLYLLFEILRMCEEIGDKVLIFSQSILSLNIIENFLETIDSKFQQECEALGEGEKDEKETFGKSWTKNLDYYRMDGTTSAQNRQTWASNFNDVDNYRARLFLISTRAGGLGINLVAANRVIIFDASWNPSHDVQSIFRVYRFGQTKPCYIYRFLAQGTMEEKIYDRQVAKLSLSQRVVDEHQIERHFSANDLKELYNFRPDRWDDGTEKPTLALPKDPLLAEILQNNKHCVNSFHEHDSLLENQVDQNLTEEEKKAAWEEYENEKKGIIIRGPGMERTASWPMMAAAQILSREQITATVQALRQQLPDISEDLFHLHVQQALRRQVQIKQEELRRMELLRLQEMSYLNMIKQQAQQSGLSHTQGLHAMQNMAPWMQIQRLRAMQNQMMMGGMGNIHPSASMSLLGQALSNQEMVERISNKPEEAIDLDDN